MVINPKLLPYQIILLNSSSRGVYAHHTWYPLERLDHKALADGLFRGKYPKIS